MPDPAVYEAVKFTTADILNAIRNNATANYRDYVPAANPNTDSIRAIGNIIMQFPALQNEFLSALVNRIGRVILSSKMYSNPWAVFKKGLMEYGESIEEIFVNLAKPFEYDPAVAENKVFKREIPDVRAAFHTLNYQKFYKTTIQERDLRQAFLSLDGVTQLIAKIVDSMYSAENYDEFLVMKYLLARHILNGQMYAEQIDANTAANRKSNVGKIKGISNALEFMSRKYNQTNVATYSNKDDQYLICTAEFDAQMDIEILASAFNMDKAQFMGHRILIDSFGSLDSDRLALIFADDTSYTPLTSAEITALNAIPAVLVDRDFFMIVDNLLEFTEQYNAEGLYWNYFYHTWKTFSASPFANAIVFVPGAPGITSVTVTPSAVTVMPGGSALLKAEVVTTNFAPKTVNWTSSNKDVTVDIYGNVTVAATATPADTATITATSTEDSNKKDTATITVGDPT